MGKKKIVFGIYQDNHLIQVNFKKCFTLHFTLNYYHVYLIQDTSKKQQVKGNPI